MKTSQYPRSFTLSHEGPQTSRETSRQRSLFSLSHLSPLFPIKCALFRAMERSQPLSHQWFAHSFPCNGGGRVRSLSAHYYPLPTFFSFQRLTNTEPEPPESGRPRKASHRIKVLILILVSLCLVAAISSSPASPSQSAGQTEPLLSNAKDLFEKGNLAEADRAVRQYVQNHPDSADGHFLLGHILFREISAKWLEQGKSEGEALLYNTGDLSGSLVAYRDAKAKESLAEFTAGAKYRAPTALDLKIVALDYLLLKDNNDADHWLTRSLQSDPRDAQAWYYLGRTKYGKGQFPEAIEAFAQCLKLEPRNIKAETNVGLSYEALERADEAAQAFQNAIAWQPESSAKDPEPFMELGHLYVNQNQPEKAVPYLTQSIAIFPMISKAHEELGKAYSLLKRFPEAQAELEKAIELTPQAPNLHCLLAPVYRKQGFEEKAKAESDRCAALSGAHSTS